MPLQLRSRFARFVPTMAAADEFYTGYAATIPAMAGSLLTFLYFGAALWAIANAAVRRYPLTVPRRSMPFVIACLSYFAVMALAELIAGETADLPKEILSNSALLVAPLLIARYRLSDPFRSLQALVSYAPLGAAAGLVLGLVQVFVFDETASGGAGNASVYGAAMVLLGSISLGSIMHASPASRVVGISGFAMGAAGVFLSDTRAFYPVLAVMPFLLLLIRPSRVRLISFGATIAMVGAVALLNSSKIQTGFENALRDISLISKGQLGTSIGLRAALWTASAQAFVESPFIGYGPQQTMDVVRSHMDSRVAYVSFTHVHNGFLQGAVSAGILGVFAVVGLIVSPLWMVFGKGENRTDRRFIALAVLLIFGVLSLTGVPFVHDLLLVMFLLPLIILAASDPRTDDITLRRGPQAMSVQADTHAGAFER